MFYGGPCHDASSLHDVKCAVYYMLIDSDLFIYRKPIFLNTPLINTKSFRDNKKTM